MVIRKPLPEHSALDSAVPPHVRDAWSPSNAEAETIWGDAGARQRQGEQSTVRDGAHAHVPNSLRRGAGGSLSDLKEDGNVWAEGVPALAKTEDLGSVPEVLRPGTGHGKDADTASQSTGPNQGSVPIPAALPPGHGVPKPETNPFKRKMSLRASAESGQPGVDKRTTTDTPPVPALPIADLQQLSINETSANPWQPALDENKTSMPAVPRLPEQDSVGDNVWASAKPSRHATPGPRSTSPALLSLPSEEGSAGWEEEPRKPANSPGPLITTGDEEMLEDAHAWDDLKTVGKGKGAAQPPPVPSKGAAGADDWNLIDVDTRPGPPSRQSSWENFKDDEENAAKTATAAQPTAGEPPALPPRRSVDAPAPPPVLPPRPVDDSETYQIKNITWHDVTASKNPRTSPILVQNANGPCPLVALVNALTLTTPDQSNTALVEALRSREQVSLGLLLDAVFDELMSERRTQPDVPLPDVTELYNFLKGLHTGMNVNPRFIPAPEVVTAFKRTSLTHLHPTERTDMIPGTFEHTKEMALYSTFSIPLIHGWLPSKDDAAYEAFARQAASYEDVQHLLFREEELEEKLCNHHEGLTPEEQQIYQDILTIKSFLSISATQLTRFGLDVIRQAMKPGSVAILFRNDHFSTLYRHPQTLELLTLVTDAGYAGHAEVVWESLVDVNGECAEFFSGDFRLVGGATHDRPGPSAGDEGANDGWTTVQGHRGRSQSARQNASPEPPRSPQHEQEDRDLALALQLQEEEDERARTEQQRRRRESLLSEQFIEQQARSGTGTRGNGNGSRAATARGSTGALPTGQRNRGASYSTTSLASTTTTGSSTGGGGRRTTPIQPSINRTSRPASASAVTSVSTHSASGANASRPRPTTQTVRSLLPPRTTTTTANRPPDEGLDDAPPSYEQAAKQLPYVPPEGHPSHPASSPTTTAGVSSSSSSMPEQLARGGRQQQQQQEVTGGGHGMMMGGGGYPGVGDGRGPGPGPFRRGVPPPVGSGIGPGGSNAGRGRDRECVVM
ncbi:protein FAM63A [Achaetomium macrosporum]|uniref:Protein FAM63A n=1 Tax=Achaetomium macrosporum TaxID=79813 RepID=A0AAN7HA29_9PEZI|nr:protein FAM63A [Achaetomium macrosporum]